MSLSEYVEVHGKRRNGGQACAVCLLDEVDQINEGLRSGVSPARILDWLLDTGPRGAGLDAESAPSIGSIRAHSERRHYGAVGA